MAEILIKISEAEKEQIRTWARSKNMNMSEYIRHIAKDLMFTCLAVNQDNEIELMAPSKDTLMQLHFAPNTSTPVISMIDLIKEGKFRLIETGIEWGQDDEFWDQIELFAEKNSLVISI
jgi:hypothetical protein